MKLEQWNRPKRIQSIIDFSSNNFDFKSKKVLDIGCNTGHLTHGILSLGPSKVIALDIRSVFTERTAKVTNGSCETILCDFFDYDCPKFDIILCCGIIYHTERQLELLRKMAKFADHIIVEGMCLQNEVQNTCGYPILALSHHDVSTDDGVENQPHWVPSRNYYEVLFKEAELDVVDFDIHQSHRILYALNS